MPSSLACAASFVLFFNIFSDFHHLVVVFNLAGLRQLRRKLRLLFNKPAFSKLFSRRFVNAGNPLPAIFLQPIHTPTQLDLATMEMSVGFRPRVHTLLIIALADEKACWLAGLALFVFMHPFAMPIQHGLGFLRHARSLGFYGL